MKRIRYLSLLMLLLGSISLWGQDDFNPSNPPEPGQPPMRLDITVSPGDAGSVSGSGRYAAGTQVTLRAYTNTGFRFVNWTNSAGEELSTATTFVYTKQEGHERLTANYVYDPTNPGEPDDPANIMYYQLQLNATEGGTVSGGGRYLANKQVTLRAYPAATFDFAGWFDEVGECISTSTSYTYTTTARHRVLEARFEFNPDSPSEPSQPIVSRTVTATATEGGSTNFSSQRVLIGSSISITAYVNTGYDFVGWYLNGEWYTGLRTFSYTVTESYDQNFEARFEFNPDNPAEPNMPTTTKHSFYIMNKVTKPGTTIKFPLYLSSVKTLTDMTFQLEFPEVLTPDFESVEMSEKAQGYNVSYTKVDATNYIFTLTGGSVPAGNTTLLVFTIQVAEELATAQNYQVKINQVSVTEEGGETVTASTRNGRISVYKNGDANGDDDVDVADAVCVVNVIVGKPVNVFLEEVANVNEDEDIDIADAVRIVNFIVGKINTLSVKQDAGQESSLPEPE